MGRDEVDRLERQKLRQRAYRARLKAERRPSNEDLARALLDLALTKYLNDGRHDELMGFMAKVAGRLERVGFTKQATEAAWFEIQDRYQRGWSLLRQRASVADLEALRGDVPETSNARDD
jgi:hypothetical protein